MLQPLSDHVRPRSFCAAGGSQWIRNRGSWCRLSSRVTLRAAAGCPSLLRHALASAPGVQQQLRLQLELELAQAHQGEWIALSQPASAQRLRLPRTWRETSRRGQQRPTRSTSFGEFRLFHAAPHTSQNSAELPVSATCVGWRGLFSPELVYSLVIISLFGDPTQSSLCALGPKLDSSDVFRLDGFAAPRVFRHRIHGPGRVEDCPALAGAEQE
jgi:hypothetical protein